jgi:hypothetical protein
MTTTATATATATVTVTVAGTDRPAGRDENVFRLGLLFFDAPDGAELHRLVESLRADGSAWNVVDDAPYDALLLARGTRLADPEHLAVLQVSAAAAGTEHPPPPIMLRKPLDRAGLRRALETAMATLGAHG